jgi:hypothetical protein
MSDIDALQEQHDKLRWGVLNTAQNLERAALMTAPSKKSEIQSGVAATLRELLDDEDNAS